MQLVSLFYLILFHGRLNRANKALGPFGYSLKIEQLVLQLVTQRQFGSFKFGFTYNTPNMLWRAGDFLGC